MTIPISLLIIHFIADFILQNDWMALNKSKNSLALTAHAIVYSVCFLGFGADFYLITLITHWITDYVTSRITSRLWFIQFNDKEPRIYHDITVFGETTILFHFRRHWFFVAIGADQLIHYVTLALTYRWLYGG